MRTLRLSKGTIRKPALHRCKLAILRFAWMSRFMVSQMTPPIGMLLPGV